MPKRLVPSVFIFVFIFYALRSSLVGSPFNPAFPDPELAVTLQCLVYPVVLTPSVLFQIFCLFIILSSFNYLLTHLPSTILFLFAFISSYISSSLLPIPSPQKWKVKCCKSRMGLFHPQMLLCRWLSSLKFFSAFLPVNANNG